jgi:transposase-like protein
MGGARGGIRKRHSGLFKAEVALEAAKEVATMNEIALRYKIHPTQVSDWKKVLLDGAANLFQPLSKQAKGEATQDFVDELFEEIGRLKFELDWLKKKLPDRR